MLILFQENLLFLGRGRRYFEFEDEMTAIFGKKRNINPEILLSTNTIEKDEICVNDSEDKVEKENLLDNTPSTIANGSRKGFNQKAVKKKTSTMEQLRLDRKVYYEEKLTIEKRKLEEIKKRNKLIEDRNQIIKEKICCCKCNSSILE